MRDNKRLDVYCQGELVGTLAETADKRIAFQYSTDWQKNGFPISPFSLPLRSDVFIPNERALDKFGGLFGVFADSLPDSWGELLLDTYLETIGIKRGSISTIERLAYVGQSGMGALEYFPVKESSFNIGSSDLDYDSIAKECSNILSSKHSDQLDMLFKVGGSSGGTRPKINLSDDDSEWIIKFPVKEDPETSGIREYEYSICAKKCGIDMTETALVPSSVCDGYFKTKRFDRDNGKKIFTITFAALLEADYRVPSCDYEAFFKLVRVLTKDNDYDIKQLFRTMCFNVLAHNMDDHTKNFSFNYTDTNGWKLAPAYDITLSDTYWGEHTTSVNGKGKDITIEDMISVGTTAGLTEEYCRQCIEEISEKTEELNKYFDSPKIIENHIPFKERLWEIEK